MKTRIGIFIFVALLLVVPMYLFEGWKSGTIMLAAAVVTFCMFVVGLRKGWWALEILALLGLLAACPLAFHYGDDTPEPRVNSAETIAALEQEIRRDLAPQIEGTFTYFEPRQGFSAITIQRYKFHDEAYYEVDVILRHTATGRVYSSYPVWKDDHGWQLGCKSTFKNGDYMLFSWDFILPGETIPVRDFVLQNGYCPPWPTPTATS